MGRLAEEASKSAGHVLKMCIRALDYLPPVDITFGEYLRGLITADFDMVEDDTHNYRVAFVEAFRRRGIYPLDIGVPGADTIRTLSVDTLRWRGFDTSELKPRERTAVNHYYEDVVDQLKRYADVCIYLKDRETLFTETRKQRKSLHDTLKAWFAATPGFAAGLGLEPRDGFEVHELRPALRTAANGRRVPQVLVCLTQSTWIPQTKNTPGHVFRGGSTLVVDLAEERVRYRIYKSIGSKARRERTAAFARDNAADPLRALLFASDRPEPFAALHALDLQ